MSTEQKVQQAEDLTKSIDSLLDEVFAEPETTEKSIDIAKDAKTTADAVMSQVPASQDDASRGAGRPKQISDVPKNDQDGKRDGQYDASIAQAHGDEENEEAKKQAKAVDQCSSAGHMAQSPKAPRSAPFKKSDGSEITEEDFRKFEAFEKAQKEEAEKAKAEELRKSEELAKAERKRETESLIKSAVEAATSKISKENEELKKSLNETQALVKAMASQPMPAKSVTSIQGLQSLEKSERPEDKGPETFSKSEILDAAMDLAMKGQISSEAVSEIEMTGRVHDASARQKIELHLQKKN